MAGHLRTSAFIAIVLALGLCAIGCNKKSAPENGAGSGTNTGAGTRVPSTSPVDTKVYPPAALRMHACPPIDSSVPPLPPVVDVGCESCKPDEHCKVTSLRGRNIGECKKSTCQKDADCPGMLCACGPPNECVTGNCRGPEDCGGRECVPNRGRYGHGTGTFCRTKNDTCRTHTDCGEGKECSYSATGWSCVPETPPPPAG